MSLVAAQAEFLLRVCDLVNYATSNGFVVTGGELWRTPEQQLIYFNSGKSKTMKSSHLNRLAIDLNFFKDGKLVSDRAVLRPLGVLWESFGDKYRWGGSWRGQVESGASKFIDCPHFEGQA